MSLGSSADYRLNRANLAMLINVHDSLYATLQEHTRRTGKTFRLKKFSMPTSVENLAFLLFSEITELGFRLEKIEVRETDTSMIEYTRADWIEDSRRFAGTEAKRGETSAEG